MDNRMASARYVLVFVSCRTAPNPREKDRYIFMTDAAFDQQLIFAADTTGTALSLPSGLLFLAIMM
jgi:hypothetical protein